MAGVRSVSKQGMAMAGGRSVSFLNVASCSNTAAKYALLVILAILAASSLLSSIGPSSRFSIHPPPRPPHHPHQSFLRSLRHFLATKAPPRSSPAADGAPTDDGLLLPDQNVTASLARDLDHAMREREARDLATDGLRPTLKVYVYDMPAKFTYDLLWLFQDTYEQTENLTSNGSPVHRLIEQHSVDYWLWADLLTPESERSVKTVTRVHDQAEADIFYIPFFTTISFFLLEKSQCKQLYREARKWITSQPAWQRSGGRDHVLPVHHPWSFKSVRRFMKNAIWLLPDVDSTGNWYKPGEVWLEKDVILPYVPNVEICNEQCLANALSQRKTLLYFRGRTKRNAGGKIRSKLTAVLQQEKGVIIEDGSIGDAGREAAQAGMRSAVFCLSPAGDTPSSARLFDAIVSGCIPVIVSDELELPFEGMLDYRKVALFVSSSQAIQPGWLVGYLRGIGSIQLSKIRNHLAKFSKCFQFANPAQPLGPEDLTWRVIAGKVESIKLQIRRTQRLVEGSRSVCNCDCKNANYSLPHVQFGVF